jgi:signal transduction histidine kinase/DNA-binding response OmpR family regulator
MQFYSRLLKRFRNIPLRRILVVPFLLQTGLALGVTLYILKAQHDAVQDISTQLRQEVGKRIEQNLLEYLDTPYQINQINATAIQNGEIDVTNPAQLEKHFWHQLQLFKEVTEIAFATPRKDFVSVERQIDGSIKVRVSGPGTGYELRTYTTNRHGDRLKVINTNKNFSPFRRPWYAISTQTRKPSWTKISPHFKGKRLYLGVGHPVYSQQGQLQGALLTNINLLQLSQFLRSLNSGKSGQCFILNRSGFLIASSTTEKLFQIPTKPILLPEDKVQLQQAIGSSNTVTQATARTLVNQLGDLKSIQRSQQLEFDVGGKQHLLQVLPLQDGRGIDWLVVVVAPTANFMQGVHLKTQWGILLSLAMLALATGLGLLITRWVTQPILQLSDAAQSIADGQIVQPVKINPVKEVNALTQSFNRMAQQLRATFASLAQTNEELEVRVEERTFELTSKNEQLLQEVSDREKAEKALQDSQSELQLMFAAMIDTVIVFDRDGRYLRYIQVPSLTYKPRLDRIGKTVHEVLPTETAHLFFEAIQRALQQREQYQSFNTYCDVLPLSQTSINVEYYLPIQGKRVWFAAYVAPLTESTVLWVGRDISDRKRSEQAIELAKQEAETANHHKSQFLARMSHELRTPLNVILGFTQLLQQQRDLNAQQQEYLQIICRSGDHLLTLINDVLDLSKIEEGVTTLSDDRVNLNLLLDWVYQMMQLKASAKGLELTFDLASELPSAIHLDEGKLRQILINLLGNAIKFTQTGSVSLSVSVLVEDPAESTTYPNDDNLDISDNSETPSSDPTSFPCWLQFEISDTGPGIDPAALDSIFEPFVQADAGLEIQQGTGLGLSICQEFVSLMGGRGISLKSQPGEGATFRFSLPTHAIAPEQESFHAPSRQIVGLQPGQPTYRILVVDDREDSRHFLVDLLTPLGFQVQEASDGEGAIVLSESWFPDLIWMDMNMPVLDGGSAAKHIKASGQRSPVIIGLTGSNLAEDRMTAFSYDCDDIILKPARTEVIFEKMAQYLGVRYRYRPIQPKKTVISNSQTSLLLNKEEVFNVLTTMPIEWVNQLHQAALRVSAKQSCELIEQISQNNPSLARTLNLWIEEYRFEDLVSATQGIEI